MAEKPTPKTQRGLSSELVIDRALPGAKTTIKANKSWGYKNKKE